MICCLSKIQLQLGKLYFYWLHLAAIHPGNGCLDASFLVTTEVANATGIKWVEARKLLNVLKCIGQPLTTKDYSVQMSLVLRLKNLVLVYILPF